MNSVAGLIIIGIICLVVFIVGNLILDICIKECSEDNEE